MTTDAAPITADEPRRVCRAHDWQRWSFAVKLTLPLSAAIGVSIGVIGGSRINSRDAR
jgi:hypothetical protein